MKFLTIFLTFISLNISANSSTVERGFVCQAHIDSFNEYFGFSTKIESVIKLENGRAILKGYDFSYQIIDNNDVWSAADVVVSEDIANNPNYRPRVYKQHYQFDLSERIFGKVKLLIPYHALTSENEGFKAALIMSKIDDHAGDTVILDCSIN